MSPRSQTQKEFWWFGGRMRGSRPKSRAEGAPRACANLGRIAVRGSFTRTRKEMAVRTREALNQWTRSFGWGSLAGQLSQQELPISGVFECSLAGSRCRTSNGMRGSLFFLPASA